MTPKADFYTGIALVILAGALFGIANGMAKPDTFGLGPGGYPMLIAGVLILLGAILAVQSWVAMRRQTPEGQTTAKSPLKVSELKGIALLGLSFFAYVTALRYAGYLAATPLFLFLFLLQYGERKWRRMILTSIIATAVTWFAFVHLFKVYLPEWYF